jgi:Pyridoxamine 5'-phosphate oxidase
MQTGWSVLVRGTLAEVTDPDDLERLRTLPLSPWAPGAKARYVRVEPASISGAASLSRPTCRSRSGADRPAESGPARAMSPASRRPAGPLA